MGDGTKGCASFFPWVGLGVALLATGVVLWMLNDLRLAVKSNIATLERSLPEILANTKKSTDTLAVLSDDIRQLRDLAGVSTQARDRSLVVFADSLLDQLEGVEGRVGLKPRLFGSALRDDRPANEWVVSARKEALWLSFRSKSKYELLTRLTKNKFGSDWYVQETDQESEKLIDWFLDNHESAEQVLVEAEAANGDNKDEDE